MTRMAVEHPDFESSTAQRKAPATLEVQFSNHRTAELLHSDLAQIGLHVSYNDEDNSWNDGFVLMAFGYGDAGLYQGLTADQAEEMGQGLIEAAKELRKLEGKEKPTELFKNGREY